MASSYFLMEKKKTLAAHIKPLGHVKRNELVKKFYLTYDVNSSSIQKAGTIRAVKAGFDMVENFLGKEYIRLSNLYFIHSTIQY